MSLGLLEFFWNTWPPNPASNKTGAGLYAALPYVSRRLRIFGRPNKHLAPNPAQAATVVNKQRLALRYRPRRPLRQLYRPRHILPLYVAAPVTGAAYGTLSFVSRRLRVFGRPRHLAPNPAQAVATIVDKRSALHFRPRKLRSIFWFPKPPLHRFAVIQHCLRNPIVGILPTDPWQRKLRIFFRPKHLTQIFPAPLPPSSLSWKRSATRNRARKPLWKFYRSRHVLGYVPPQPSTQNNVEWIVRHRRRGRR